MRELLKIDGDWRGEPVATQERARVELQFDSQRVEIVVDAPFFDDPPPTQTPGRVDRLWEHEVVEVFLLGPQQQYTEIELGPHGHHLVLRLAGVRRVVDHDVPIRFSAQITGKRWHGRATLSSAHAPHPVLAVNAYAIHGKGAARRYLAACPVPGEQPDFHRLDCFRRLPTE